MRLPGLLFMPAALLITFTTGSPLPAVVSLSNAKRDLVDTVGVTFTYSFSNYSYDIQNSQCQASPPSFNEIIGIEFAANYQFCWFYKNGTCGDDEMPVCVGAGDDLHSKIGFVPQSMFCYDPTFKCPGGGQCH